ncbi:MAG: CPBP family intramembrane glutamic endopeptidase [Chthoniobacter sp.]|uniref:CPBP family intramembrane glutamic endopeptidase n=1 Tax=Chthoniobacter sp. TaxID=2510640 RepID=UPI0032AC9E48
MSDESPVALTPSSALVDALPPPSQPVSKIRWGIHLAIMAALPLVAGLGGVSNRGGEPALGHNVRGLLIVSAFEVLFFAVFFVPAWLASRANRDDLLLRWRPGYWVVPLGVAYSVAIRLAVGVLALCAMAIVMVTTKTSLAGIQKFTEENRPKVETLLDMQALTHDPAYFWLAVVLVSFVVGGLREELWRSSFLAGLRSVWPRAFASNRGGIAGAGVAALFFGAAHIPQGMLAAGMITIVGFLLGVMMSLHRSVWPSAIAHGLFDATSMVQLVWLTRHLPEWQKMSGGH